LVDASGQKVPRNKNSLGRRPLVSECETAAFFVPFPSALKRTMKKQNDVELSWQETQQKYFNTAVGYYELGLIEEAEAELNKIDASVISTSISALELKLAISYCRNDWKQMKAIARNLYLLDSSNPQYPFSDGYATGRIDSVMSKED
jgi:hypothetical protein